MEKWKFVNSILLVLEKNSSEILSAPSKPVEAFNTVGVTFLDSSKTAIGAQQWKRKNETMSSNFNQKSPSLPENTEAEHMV